VSSGITITCSNVTVNNLAISASTSLVTVPAGELDHMHGIRINPNLTGITISGGSITGATNTNTKGVYCQLFGTEPLPAPLTEANNNGSEVTITGMAFNSLRNGVVCNGLDSLTVTGSTFSGCRVGIGSTEYTTLTNITTNSFTNAPVNIVEGIGLGAPVTYTGQPDLIAYLLANNTWDGTFVTGSEAGNRINDYRTYPPAIHY
jgi:hypothetical protein